MKRCTRDLRMVSYIVDMLSESEQVKMPGKSWVVSALWMVVSWQDYIHLSASREHPRLSDSDRRTRRL
jgi:hypothetical protein